MAAGAAVQPDGGEASAFGSSASLPHQASGTAGTARRLDISATDLPFFEERAGRADLHALAAARCSCRMSPQGCVRSVMTRQSTPRPMTSQVCAPSISSQTRTQRVQRMQRLWSTTKRSCEASTGSSRVVVREVDVGHAELAAPASAARSGRWRRRPSRRDCARRRAARGSSRR